jgi:hypothetical protein
MADPSTDLQGVLSQLITVSQNSVIALGNIVQALKAVFPQGTGTSATATGGAATLPANPVGYIDVVLPNGVSARVPYYSP